jgi:hypothetical protein
VLLLGCEWGAVGSTWPGSLKGIITILERDNKGTEQTSRVEINVTLYRKLCTINGPSIPGTSNAAQSTKIN